MTSRIQLPRMLVPAWYSLDHVYRAKPYCRARRIVVYPNSRRSIHRLPATQTPLAPDEFSLAALTVLELAPSLIDVAAACGYQQVGLRLLPAVAGGVAYPLMEAT